MMGLFGKAKRLYPALEVLNNKILFDGHNQPLLAKNIPGKLVQLLDHTTHSIGTIIDGKASFCGYDTMNGFPSINRNIIWIENLSEYKESRDVMIQDQAEMVYPRHGESLRKDEPKKYKNELRKN